MAPVLLGAAPFGLVAGVAAGRRRGGPARRAGVLRRGLRRAPRSWWRWTCWATTPPSCWVLVTALAVNARFLLYSAALAPLLAGTSVARRGLVAYLLTDQAYALTVVRGRTSTDDAAALSRYFLGAGATLWVVWVVATAVGALGGASVPDDVDVGFAVPLMFLALLVPSVRDRAGLVAALVGGGAAPAARAAGVGVAGRGAAARRGGGSAGGGAGGGAVARRGRGRGGEHLRGRGRRPARARHVGGCGPRGLLAARRVAALPDAALAVLGLVAPAALAALVVPRGPAPGRPPGTARAARPRRGRRARRGPAHPQPGRDAARGGCWSSSSPGCCSG